jgi:hypothetical protein
MSDYLPYWPGQGDRVEFDRGDSQSCGIGGEDMENVHWSKETIFHS